jgi:hypothetical protein
MEIRKPLKTLRGWFPQEPTLPKHLKIKLDLHKRNWFPKDPLIAAIKTTDDEKFNRWALCPFLTPGALMSLLALLSGLFGFVLVFAYIVFVVAGTTNITTLYPGILCIGAFILGTLSSILLLANRSIVKATVCILGVFSFGIATFVALPLLDGLRWDSFLVVALPMVALSAASLILVGLNYRKLKNSLITKEDNIKRDKPDNHPDRSEFDAVD